MHCGGPWTGRPPFARGSQKTRVRRFPRGKRGPWPCGKGRWKTWKGLPSRGPAMPRPIGFPAPRLRPRGYCLAQDKLCPPRMGARPRQTRVGSWINTSLTRRRIRSIPPSIPTTNTMTRARTTSPSATATIRAPTACSDGSGRSRVFTGPRPMRPSFPTTPTPPTACSSRFPTTAGTPGCSTRFSTIPRVPATTTSLDMINPKLAMDITGTYDRLLHRVRVLRQRHRSRRAMSTARPASWTAGRPTRRTSAWPHPRTWRGTQPSLPITRRERPRTGSWPTNTPIAPPTTTSLPPSPPGTGPHGPLPSRWPRPRTWRPIRR